MLGTIQEESGVNVVETERVEIVEEGKGEKDGYHMSPYQ